MTEAQILALAGALSSVGIEAQAGGSAMSKVIIEMQLAAETGGERLADFARVAGMSAQQFADAFREDATNALMAFIGGLQTAEERGVSTIKVLHDMGLTEQRMRDALLRAAGAGELFAKAIATGTQAWQENTALTNEAAQRYETAASKLEDHAQQADGRGDHPRRDSAAPASVGGREDRPVRRLAGQP